MNDDPTVTTSGQAATDAPAVEATSELETVTEDLLVEDVSIDGMCGVY